MAEPARLIPFPTTRTRQRPARVALALTTPASRADARDALAALSAANAIATGHYGATLLFVPEMALVARGHLPQLRAPTDSPAPILIACHSPHHGHGLHLRLSHRVLDDLQQWPHGPRRGVALAHAIADACYALHQDRRRSASLLAFYDEAAGLVLESQPHTPGTCIADCAPPTPLTLMARVKSLLWGD